jgi:hypothetical protein
VGICLKASHGGTANLNHVSLQIPYRQIFDSNGDWGDVDREDKQVNNQSMRQGSRLLSAYNDELFGKHGVAKIWIITEADRSCTTVLFPDEY